ncbi:aspartate aminotransferase family protein, partial [Alphaproteobacteria bacterium]|nr:aspartate aminotransferase family protein [Alphaproteobacteria bacterium]
RNIGLVGAIQLESGDVVGARGRAAFEKLWDEGISCRPIGDSLAMSPPLILTEADIQRIGEMYRTVLSA